MVIWVTTPKAFHDELVQKRGGSEAIRRRITGELRFADREGKATAVGDFEAAREQIGARAKKPLHFSCGTEMVITIQTLFGMLLAQQSESADTLNNVVLPAVGGQFVMDGQRSDGRQGRNGLMD